MTVASSAPWEPRLSAMGLLREGDAPLPPQLSAYCDSGRLVGGLSVALDVRPDELVGPLLQHMGGGALSLKILDVRDQETVELTVELGGELETWKVQDARDLVAKVNAAFQADDEVSPVV